MLFERVEERLIQVRHKYEMWLDLRHEKQV